MAEFKTSPQKRDYSRQYYLSHKEQYRKHAERWWKAHPDKLRAKERRRLERRRPARRIYQKAYRQKNLETVRAKNRKWQSDQWAHRQAYMRRYYAKHKEKIKSRVQKCYQENKARWWNYGAKRRALTKQAASNLKIIQEFVESIRKKKRCFCYYCGTCLPGADVHFDHIIPLAKGGAHSIENLCVSCPPCNLSKNDMLLSRWTKHAQTFLPI